MLIRAITKTTGTVIMTVTKERDHTVDRASVLSHALYFSFIQRIFFMISMSHYKLNIETKFRQKDVTRGVEQTPVANTETEPRCRRRG